MDNPLDLFRHYFLAKPPRAEGAVLKRETHSGLRGVTFLPLPAIPRKGHIAIRGIGFRFYGRDALISHFFFSSCFFSSAAGKRNRLREGDFKSSRARGRLDFWGNVVLFSRSSNGRCRASRANAHDGGKFSPDEKRNSFLLARKRTPINSPTKAKAEGLRGRGRREGGRNALSINYRDTVLSSNGDGRVTGIRKPARNPRSSN